MGLHGPHDQGPDGAPPPSQKRRGARPVLVPLFRAPPRPYVTKREKRVISAQNESARCGSPTGHMRSARRQRTPPSPPSRPLPLRFSLFRRGVPDDDGLAAEVSQLPAVGAPGQRPSEARQVIGYGDEGGGGRRQRKHFRPCRRVPELDGPVRACGGDALTVRAPGRRTYQVLKVIGAGRSCKAASSWFASTSQIRIGSSSPATASRFPSGRQDSMEGALAQ